MKFGEYLDNELNSRKSDNKSFVAQLNVLDDVFKNVDEITFSRWRNGRATPVIKKQFLINKKLGHSVKFFIESITLPKRSKTYDDRVKRIFKREFSYNYIDYFTSVNSTVILSSKPTKNIKEMIFSFYSLFSFYKPDSVFRNLLNDENTNLLYLKSTGFDIPNSHTAITFFPKRYNLNKFSFEENSYLIHVGYYRSSFDYRFLLSYSLLHIYRNIDIDTYIYVIVRENFFIDFLDDINSILIFNYKTVEGGLNDYGLYKFKLVDILSIANIVIDCQEIESSLIDSDISEVMLCK